MLWKHQNRRDREILAAMMLSGHRVRALEIYTTAHWKLLPDASSNDSGEVYACRDGISVILATNNDDYGWTVDIRYTNLAF